MNCPYRYFVLGMLVLATPASPHTLLFAILPHMFDRPSPSREKPAAPSSREAVHWAEQQVRRFKQPATKWLGMAAMLLAAEGCVTFKDGVFKVASVAAMEPEAARVELQPGAAPGANGDGRITATLNLGLSARPETPGDSLWWNRGDMAKGEGIFDARLWSKKKEELKRSMKPDDLPPWFLIPDPNGKRFTQTTAIVKQHHEARNGQPMLESEDSLYSRGIDAVMQRTPLTSGLRLTRHEVMIQGIPPAVRGRQASDDLKLGPLNFTPSTTATTAKAEAKMQQDNKYRNQTHELSLRVEEFSSPNFEPGHVDATLEQGIVRRAFENNGRNLLVEDRFMLEGDDQHVMLFRGTSEDLAKVVTTIEELESKLPYLTKIRQFERDLAALPPSSSTRSTPNIEENRKQLQHDLDLYQAKFKEWSESSSKKSDAAHLDLTRETSTAPTTEQRQQLRELQALRNQQQTILSNLKQHLINEAVHRFKPLRSQQQRFHVRYDEATRLLAVIAVAETQK